MDPSVGRINNREMRKRQCIDSQQRVRESEILFSPSNVEEDQPAPQVATTPTAGLQDRAPIPESRSTQILLTNCVAQPMCGIAHRTAVLGFPR